MYKVNPIGYTASTLTFLKWNEETGIAYACEKEDAEGIVINHNDDESIYKLVYKEYLDDYEHVTIEEISTEEYLTSRLNELDATSNESILKTEYLICLSEINM